MSLENWAAQWGVPQDCFEDLLATMGIAPPGAPTDGIAGESEAAAQTRVRLEATRQGARLWRNNVGAFETDDGGFVRYGLANESKAMNAAFKSSDLIGIRPVLIGQEHVGKTIGQFVAREIKAPGWTYKAKGREAAQRKFIEFILSKGGDAAFSTGSF